MTQPPPSPGADPVWAPVAPIERFLRDYTAALRLPPNLVSAIEYSLVAGGKRLRPLLCWHACEALGVGGEAALPAAGAIELIHAFSLIHDDLPAMDDDDLRRGRPTLHIHAGEAMAILAGDAMLPLAFGLLNQRHPPALAAELIAELVQGTTGMIAGQVYDTLGGFHESTTPAQRVLQIHSSKTGALIRAACRMGALTALRTRATAEADAPLRAITSYADAVGLMFQIVDDLLDVEQTPEHTGKRTRKDHHAGKLTYPGVHGLENSRSEIERLRLAAVSALASLGPRAQPLRTLADLLAVRDR